MNSKKIFIIRHGQTELNRLGIVQGSGVDSSLNESGRMQAEAFYQAYRDIPFGHVFTSALKRSQESVESFLNPGIRHTILPGLNEISWGEKEGKRMTSEEDAYYKGILSDWRQGKTFLRIEGGESPEEVVERLKPAVEVIRQVEEENILVCMHGRALRILLCYLLQEPLRNMDDFDHSNLCLYLLQQKEEGFLLIKRNDTSHLSSLK